LEAFPLNEKLTYEELEQRVMQLEKDNSEFKRLEESLKNRIVALTLPLNDYANIAFDELFNIDDIQRIQDEFAKVTGVASIITHTDGTPITAPSNFCRLCKDIIRKTDKGLANCFKSDSLIGRLHPGGPIILPCTSGGLWDAGAGITVGGRHIANWLIGQVRDEFQTEDKMLEYANEIGASEKDMVEAFREVPAMSHEQFEQIAKILFILANQLSTSAYQNVQQSRFITEHKQVEELLRLSENKLRATLDATPFPIAVVDLQDDTIFYWSSSAVALFGHTAPTASEWYQIAYPDPDYRREVIERWKPFLEIARESGRPVNTGEYRVTCRDRSVRICELYATFLPDNLIVTFHDITDRKQADEQKAELEVQNRQLQKSESLGRMAGAIAHHFNNHLHVVMGNLEMAMNDLPIGLNPIEKLLSAMQAARKAAEVSNLMLTYIGKTPDKHEPMDLSKFCCNIMPLLQTTAPKGVIFKADFPTSGPIIRASADQIQHILTNLLANAWESFDGNRRDICLTVKTVIKEDILTLKCFPLDWQPQEIAYACIEVSDEGCGISEENFEKIFDPFFSTKFTGRGLGLSVVLGIVRAHHGAVTVESKFGRGSIFRVFFPVSAEEVPILPHKSFQTLKTEEGGTVLTVEYDENVRNMVKTMLIHLGFSVLEAKNGVEAVEVFRQHQREIRCVICDLSMPRMDGWETLTALRNLSPYVPVILSSGYNKELIMAGEHPELPSAFLSKPYHLKELSDTIHRVSYASDWHG
jgi:PAS domain S-box-containing protein